MWDETAYAFLYLSQTLKVSKYSNVLPLLDKDVNSHSSIVKVFR